MSEAPVTELPIKRVPLNLNAAFVAVMNNGTFTLHNTKNDTHRTFRIRQREGAIRVGLLNGPDNHSNFADFATITIDGDTVKIAPDIDETPNCPKCGKPMVLRIQRKGKKVGKSFWGCSQYPRCFGIVPHKPNPIGTDNRNAYARTLEAVIKGETWGGLMRVLSSGFCAICGRKLTTPESVDSSIGPECRSKIGPIA